MHIRFVLPLVLIACAASALHAAAPVGYTTQAGFAGEARGQPELPENQRFTFHEFATLFRR